MKLRHKEIYIDDALVAVKLPFTKRMQEFHPDGNFPLLDDPIKSECTSIIGMFILRPARQAWEKPVLKEDGSCSVYDVKDWVYNLNSINGGAVIANGNIMDGYRLGMQYAVSDAVIIGSSTVLNDGLPDSDGTPGYTWLPYNCTEWPHLKAADSKMMDRFLEQRKLWQDMGYVSDRTYPAQIVVTQSGKETTPDLLSASVFHEHHPDGTPVETFILTSKSGAENIKTRAGKYGLAERINDMLIILSPQDDPHKIDLPELPGILYTKYNIKIANHDGGAMVLRAFCEAGIVAQFNFTFGRRPSLFEVVKSSLVIKDEERNRVLDDFDHLVLKFFNNHDGSIPGNISIAQIIVDEPDEAAVLVLDTRNVRAF